MTQNIGVPDAMLIGITSGGSVRWRFGEGLDTYVAAAITWCGRRAATFGLVLFLLLRRLAGDIEDTLSTLHAHAFQRSLDLDARRVDDLSFVDEFDTDLLSLVDAHPRLGGNAGAKGTHVATVYALAVLQQANEHLGRAVEDGLNVSRRHGRLVRDELDELLELDIRMQVNGGVPEGFSGLVEADFAFNGFDLDHDSLIYC